MFPVLVLLLVLGGGLTWLLAGADPEAGWLRPARRTMLIAFFTSVLLSLAPFTLMESHHGWRMNSMVTRWFVLPVPTSLLVLIPFVAACASVTVFVGIWMLYFNRLFPGLDFLHVFLALLLGVAVMQALAWILPRRPSQFWPLLALWFVGLLMLTVLPLDSPAWEPQRRALRLGAPIAIPLLGGIAYAAARLNRCGRWPGELPLGNLVSWLLRGQPALPAVKTPAAALFWSDVVPVVRSFAATWWCLVLLLTVLQASMLAARSPAQAMNPAIILQVAAVLMPSLGVLWLTVGGLFLGGEPGTGFRTALSPFRGVRPVSAGTLVTQRVLAAIGLWLLVWIPWLLLHGVQVRLHPQWAAIDLPDLHAAAGRLMAISAHSLVGALPLFLWGRLDGFPNMLLAAMVAWAATWGLASAFPPPTGDALAWRPLGVLLVAKFGLGLAALLGARRAGHTSWRYGGGLILGWLCALGLLVWALPTWDRQGWWGLATIALFLPFARLALAPLALAANRHR